MILLTRGCLEVRGDSLLYRLLSVRYRCICVGILFVPTNGVGTVFGCPSWKLIGRRPRNQNNIASLPRDEKVIGVMFRTRETKRGSRPLPVQSSTSDR